jgi:DHA2 family multidrug resistance protein-like MFS transporter
VADRLHDNALADAVRVAFVHGMDLTLVVSGGLVLAGAILAVLFLPRRVPPTTGGETGARAAGHPAGHVDEGADGHVDASVEASAGAGGAEVPAGAGPDEHARDHVGE